MVLQGVAADRPFRARGRAGLRARVLLPVPARSGTQAQASSQAESRGNGHGVSATPENVSRCRHDRFPHPGPLPVGEGDLERALRDFHGKALRAQVPRSHSLAAPQRHLSRDRLRLTRVDAEAPFLGEISELPGVRASAVRRSISGRRWVAAKAAPTGPRIGGCRSHGRVAMGAELLAGACAGGLLPRGGWGWVATEVAPTGARIGECMAVSAVV